MPIKYRVKLYTVGAYYHIYNKGLNGQVVFGDETDYREFLEILRTYVCKGFQPETEVGFKTERPSVLRRRQEMNMAGQVVVHAYCLMPDHFHLLLSQTTPDGMTKCMRRVMTRYVMYFNKRYKRMGPLFETNYRAVEVESGETLAQMTRFIHLNPVTRIVKRFGPVETVTGTTAGDYPYSSYNQYVGSEESIWVSRAPGVPEGEKYRKFVEDGRGGNEALLRGIMIDGGDDRR